jgi:hypothetical protein
VRRSPLLLVLVPALALAAAPLKRIQQLLDKGEPTEAAAVAQKWLEKNDGKAGAVQVKDLLSEAEWLVLLRRPSTEGVRAWRARWPASPHAAEAATLEANQALLAALGSGGEDALREVADRYPGTAAADDAFRAAESAAWARVQTAAVSEPLSTFLGRYPTSPHRKEALELFRGLAWREAEAQNSVAAWIALRAADPEHPRAAEARLREEALAWEAVPADADAATLWNFARRYWSSNRAWQAVDRAMAVAVVTDGSAPRGELRAPSIQLGSRTLSLSVVPPGELPDGVSLHVEVESQLPGGGWEPWETTATAWLAGHGLPPPVTPSQVPGRWETPLGLCEVRGPDGQAAARRLVVELRWGGEPRRWQVPIAGGPPCLAGPALLLRRDDTGLITEAQGAWIQQAPPMDLLGMTWRCQGPALGDESTIWLTCGGWQVARVGPAYAARPPGRRVETLAERALPTTDGSVPWVEVMPSPAWFLGGAGGCYWPGSPPAPEVPDLVRAVPAIPAWVEPGFQPLEDRSVDLDGDKAPERLLVYAGRADSRAWVLWVPDEPEAPAWARPTPDLEAAFAGLSALRPGPCGPEWGAAPAIP